MTFKGSRGRIGALVVVLALVAGACGGDSNKKVDASKSDKTTTTDFLDTTTSSALAGDGSTTTTAKGGSTATTVKGGTTVTTAHSGGGTTAPTAPPSTDPNAVPVAAKSGTYRYSQSGTTPDGPAPASGKLVVNGGSYARYYDESKGPQTLIYDFRANGPYVTSVSVVAKGIAITCTLPGGVPFPPWPPNAGDPFSGSGTCTGLGGPYNASFSGHITSVNGDLIGLSTDVTVTNGGNTNVKLHDVEQWSRSLRVPKSTTQTFSGPTPIGDISGNVSSTLTSTP